MGLRRKRGRGNGRWFRSALRFFPLEKDSFHPGTSSERRNKEREEKHKEEGRGRRGRERLTDMLGFSSALLKGGRKRDGVGGEDLLLFRK